MKQPVEIYPDFSHLSDYLKDIEVLADRLGIEVDDLLTEKPPVDKVLSKNKKVLYINRTKKVQDGIY